MACNCGNNTNTEVDIDNLKTLLKGSVIELFKEENLNDRLGEQAISFRFALHLNCIYQNSGIYDKNIVVDSEYNKNQKGSKKVYEHCEYCCVQENKCIIREDYALQEDNSQSFSDYIKHRIKMLSKRQKYKSSRPDIVIHKRNENNNNLLIVEVKLTKNLDPYGRKSDCTKLTYFTCKQSEYKYTLGAFVDIGEDNAEITWYQNANIEKKEKYTKGGKWVNVCVERI